ncbi:class I SAM-dependent methyltransferase [Phyllobacterium zundukense]|uniref:Ubiquinone biosynthesis protein n=1 Tax=Phyllobacterium zundukense TaxID=1867719 RepID=A0A2N9VXJ2_9HYPH|nr:class I SAM-dependent methyltransferase [Phyllobacterium zundukense]ATU95568.1 ubiquinone biosynthesis protein [Phyllobacterium zundukense]PIO44210.1 ubiquinone biosynthesis protein [Phyllobacterium zundukense]
MTTEEQVAKHYTHGALERTILEALIASGKDIDTLVASDMSVLDELHLGWRAATVELGKNLGVEPHMRLLDVGSGIGGPARYFAETYECRVTGVDLTDEFVEVAEALTSRCGLDDRVSFHQASALALPFEDQSFDAATMIHVGMNIEDKATLFAEVHRVLKPGARFGVYDVMRMLDVALAYPMPWAETNATSFVETRETYRRLLMAHGFEIEQENSRRELALKLAQEMREKAAIDGPSPLGPHVIMGAAAKPRLANVFEALQNGVIAPIEIIARA